MADSPKLYCVCMQPDDHRFMISCDRCSQWFHGKCVGQSRVRNSKTWEWGCPKCTSIWYGEWKQKAKVKDQKRISTEQEPNCGIKEPVAIGVTSHSGPNSQGRLEVNGEGVKSVFAEEFQDPNHGVGAPETIFTDKLCMLSRASTSDGLKVNAEAVESVSVVKFKAPVFQMGMSNSIATEKLFGSSLPRKKRLSLSLKQHKRLTSSTMKQIQNNQPRNKEVHQPTNGAVSILFQTKQTSLLPSSSQSRSSKCSSSSMRVPELDSRQDSDGSLSPDFQRKGLSRKRHTSTGAQANGLLSSPRKRPVLEEPNTSGQSDVPDNVIFFGQYATVKDENKSNDDTVVYRCALKSEKDAKLWLEAFKYDTCTNWIVLSNIPNPQRDLFNKTWCCHLSSKNKKKNQDCSSMSKKRERFTGRDQNCPVTLQIKIKKNSVDTKRNDPIFLKKFGFQGVVVINKRHSHPVLAADALRLLRAGSSVKKEFMELFNDGLSPSEARGLKKSLLLLRNNGYELIANGSILPVERTVRSWHQEWRINIYGDQVNPLEKIKEKVPRYLSLGIDIYLSTTPLSPWAILVVTPIMKRVQELQSSQEVIFVDTTASVDATSSNLTVLLSASGAGAMPVGVLIHESQSMLGYEIGFSLLKQSCPNCFGGKPEPVVFMTDGSDAEKGALRAIFRTALQFLCHFHKAQNEWQFLNEAKNKVPLDLRPIYMKCFQKVMYSKTEEEFEENKKNFFDTVQHTNYRDRMIKNLEDDKVKEWVLYFRVKIVALRGHDTNNYAEACIRIIKDIVLYRMKAFNPAALVDYVANVWEDYLEGRLLDFAFNRRSGPRLTYTKLLRRMPAHLAEKIEVVDENTYLVPSVDEPSKFYHVYRDIGFCTCWWGIRGRFCKHQVSVQENLGVLFPNTPPVTWQARYALGKLALGPKCPAKEFFLGVGDDPEEVLEENDFIDADSNYVAPTSAPINIEEAVDSRPQVDLLSEDEKALLINDCKREFGRIVDLISNEEVFAKSGPVFVQKLKSIKKLDVAKSAFIRLKTAAVGVTTRRAGIIKCQPTSIMRRKSGKPRGSKRIKAGRPFKGERVSSKLRHSLSLAVSMNKKNAH